MGKKTKQTEYSRPQPPADIEGPALVEWDRICGAIESMGRQIRTADRSILSAYCRTWIINQKMYEHIHQFGAVIKWPNGVIGASPQFKTYKETTVLLRGLLADLGCTPASRDFDIIETKAQPEEPKDLEF